MINTAPISAALARAPAWGLLSCLAAGMLVSILGRQFDGNSALPLIGLDVLILFCIPIVGPVIAMAVVFAELIVVTSSIFGIPSVVFSVPAFLWNYPLFPWSFQFFFYISLVGFLLLCWGAQRLVSLRDTPRLAVCILAALPWIQVYEAVKQDPRPLGFVTRSLWSGQGWAFRLLWNNRAADDFATRPSVVELDAAIEEAVRRHRRVIYIVVEALGIPSDVALKLELDAILLLGSVTDRYHVRAGARAFEGVTIHGEFRELCGVVLQNLMFTDPPENCLPERLQKQGYLTTAWHGNDSRFYWRESWYPRIGFERIEDARTLHATEGSVCGSGWGMHCDPVLLKAVSDADAGVPRFDYVLTLDSHYPPTTIQWGDGALRNCNSGMSADVCLQASNLARVLREIRKLVDAHKNTLFIVVGDHAPRFLWEPDNQRFIAGQVPYFVFQPRG